MPAMEIAAALAHMLQGDEPFLLQQKARRKPEYRQDEEETTQRKKPARKERPAGKEGPPEEGMERFRIAVGHDHGVKPGNIVGAIANEAGLDSQYIGRINIYDDYSLIDLPEGMPKDIFNDLKKTRVAGQELKISRLTDSKPPAKRKSPEINKKREKGTKNKGGKQTKSKAKPKKARSKPRRKK